MAVLEVVKWPSKVLETVASPVEKFDDSLRKVVKDMHETMDSHSGIGLAANQVGILQRIFIVCIPYFEGTPEEKEAGEWEDRKWWHDKRFTFINPVLEFKPKKIKMMEGCLSFPHIFEAIERSEVVRIKAFDEFGKEIDFEVDGLFSVCVQHELDHLNGIVFTKRMSRLKAEFVRKRMGRVSL